MAWTVDDLKKDYDKIKAICDSEGSPSEKIRLKKILHTISMYIKYIESGSKANYIYDIEKERDDIDVLLRSMNNYKEYYPTIEKHFDIVKNAPCDCTSPIYGMNYYNGIKEKEMYGLIHDMFKSCGKKIFKLYRDMEKVRGKTLNIDGNDTPFSGVIFPIPILKKNYITIGMKPNRVKESLISLTHEYGHGIGALMNDDRYHDGDKFTEIDSYFFELIGLDYYANVTNDESYKYVFERLINNNFLRALKVIDLKESCEKAYRDGTSYEDTRDKCNKYLEEIGYHFDKNPVNLEVNLTYLYSYICAVELFEIYKEDKEEAFNIFERIVNRDKKESEYDGINNNITPTKRMIKHIKRVKHVNND